MRKLIYTVFVAFWASVLTLLLVGALAPRQQMSTGSDRLIDLEELSRHATESDCWMEMQGQVYDFTAYLPEHPAPPEFMLIWCGKRATEGMRTKGYGRDHSPAAWQLAEQYRIGVFKE